MNAASDSMLTLGTVVARAMTDPGSDAPGIQRGIDNSVAPALKIDPGTTVLFECPGLPMPPNASVADLSRIDPERPHTIVGPVYVNGARPGDTLVVDILEVELAQDYGHTVIIPGLGLLGGEFDVPYVHNFSWEAGATFVELKEGIRIPIRPFCGFLGNSPATPGEHSTTPPRNTGGNLDLRHLVAGSRLLLPVEVEGGLFYCGDGHAAQGDGEVCLTAVETAIRATLRISLNTEHPVAAPEFQTPAQSVATEIDHGSYATVGIGPDLYVCSQDAIRRMIDYLVTQHELSREEAYVLCSVAVDLKVGEVVDAPNWVVSAHLPLGIFAADPAES